jgi:sterol desaturase/sphingolipid hydroxylase (fatty acid hydroxylase superfamily)
MLFMSLEHSKRAYIADFLAYGVGSAGLAVLLAVGSPRGAAWTSLVLVVVGWSSWTLIEYLLHRFVLHGVYPFSQWHAEHHRRPVALICTPTLVSAALVFSLVFVPAWLLVGLWPASAVTLGVLIGYLGYAVTHHATHHWRADNTWLNQRKRWHALHHGSGRAPGHYGVTSAFWDRVFGSAHPRG